MRESNQRRRGPWRLSDASFERTTRESRATSRTHHRRVLMLQVSRIASVVILAVLLLPAAAFAQSPWERAASNLERTFTGPLARSLALVAIVIGGLMFMFGEAGAKRQISGIVFGGALALFAAQFLAWLF